MSVHPIAPCVFAIDCDTTNCERVIRPERTDLLEWHSEFREWLHEQGWSMWVGRGSRTYCPDHGPRPGHKMRRLDQL